MTAFGHATTESKTSRPSIALAHDYVTQRGGAERVVLAMARAFPDSQLHTTLYRPETTFEDFQAIDIRVSPLNRHRLLRNYHRLAFPLLASAVSRMRVDAGLLIASSSGWAHGIRGAGKKIVYCHAPARWLYQSARYVGSGDNRGAVKRLVVGGAAYILRPPLLWWDRRQARTVDRYIANSNAVRDSIRNIYGIDAQVVFPPPAVTPENGSEQPVETPSRPYVLCVARLLPYKNVDVVIDAVARVPEVDLVVVGAGPERAAIARRVDRTPNAHLLGSLSDPEMRWLYRNSIGIVAASHEDFGLTPIEAATFGRPTAALRAGGYLDTVREHETGLFFDSPTVDAVAAAVTELVSVDWDPDHIRAHAEKFSESRFIAELRGIVDRELREQEMPEPAPRP